MKKKYFIVLFVIFFVIGITSIFIFSGSRMSSRVVDYNGDKLLVSVDGEEVKTIPTSSDYYLSSYSCKSKNTVIEWDKDKHQLYVSNGGKSGGVSCYLEFSSTPKLSDMKVGSYVKYVGNNGCSGNTCSGVNVNYVDDSNHGYCNNVDSKFYGSGFRIAYSMGGSAYLVSAGSPECICTNGSGFRSSSCDSSISVDGLSNHFSNLDAVALKYCNSNYVYNGVCDVNSVRNINSEDFALMLGKRKDLGSCFGMQDKKCGYDNDLIDVGSDYWYAVSSVGFTDLIFYWSSSDRIIKKSNSGYSYGVRPIIRLDSNVLVVGGDGSRENPYEISNYTFFIGDKDLENSKINLEMVGYKVDTMCASINSAVCTNYVPFDRNYVLNVGNVNDGENIIYVYYKDASGDVVAVINKKFYVDK